MLNQIKFKLTTNYLNAVLFSNLNKQANNPPPNN